MENVQPNNCITLNELKQLLEIEKQQVKIIDVRSRDEFIEMHIPGAINIEHTQIDLAKQLFDKNDIVITACGKGGGRSTEASAKLKTLGFTRVYWLCGGTFGWA